jgi:hypothetical protein
VRARLIAVEENPSVKFRPYVVSKEIRFLKVGKACVIDGILN